ncbi:pirin family protein [Cellvibrio sp. UBA7661]|uniref:pirin family protein n=1 Tax=Cellvibrio sp. UBA7661 TaxID=1946311 RepID=UPI002F35AEEB
MTLLIPPRTQDIGFTVKRLLPSRIKQRVGPFIFVDHMGPAHFEAGTTAGDVRQHPHFGLATVTYLFSGAMMHRDSLGSVQRIEPGAINIMTAGKGIVHSERLPEDIREQQDAVEGIQTWLALPTDVEDCEPSFAHYAADEIPSVNLPALSARVLIGSAFDVESPVKTASKTTYIDLSLGADTQYQPDFPQQELAIYVAWGNVTVNDEPVPEYHLAVLDEHAVISTVSGARILLLGGEPLDGERFILWNFVASSREKLRAAGERWTNGGFEMVPGEVEWIPLPTIS